MTDFSTVRIPATRAGSGIRRVTLPSGTVRVGGPRSGGPGYEGSARIDPPLARFRRHVSKGFYDEWPGTTPGSEVIDNENEQVDDTVTDIMQIVSVNLTFPTVRSLPSPSSLGILLIFNVIGGLGSVDIDTTYGGGAPYAKVLRNEIEYILFTFNTIGQTVTLLSIPEDVGVGHRWLCIDATSSVTWTT